ncbi:hypothetical protein EDB86DRAFT_2077624 [Lactarius hatsudake]|nr:hypothetical protein EDB86DRAFT_2077624 [Lactarius hatsudake]
MKRVSTTLDCDQRPLGLSSLLVSSVWRTLCARRRRHTKSSSAVYGNHNISKDDTCCSLARAKPSRGLCHVDFLPTLGLYYRTLLWWSQPQHPEAWGLRVERQTLHGGNVPRSPPGHPHRLYVPYFSLMSALEDPSGEHGVTSLTDRHRALAV